MAGKQTKGEIFFFHGAESFLLQERVQSWHKACTEKFGAFNVQNVKIFNTDRKALEKQVKQIANEILTPSFFGEKRVMFIEQFPPSASLKIPAEIFQPILQAAENVPPQNVLVFSSESPDKRTKAFKQIEKISRVEIFSKLQPGALATWVREQFAKQNVRIANTTAWFLVQFAGEDLWKLSHEIRKLGAFCAVKGLVEKGDIEKVCLRDSALENFALANALQSGNAKKIVDVFHQTVEKEVDPHGTIFIMLLPFLRNVLKTKWALEKNRNATAVGLHPFVFQKCQKVAREFSWEKLQSMMQAIGQIDLATKTGKLEITAHQREVCLVLEKFFVDFFAGKCRTGGD